MLNLWGKREEKPKNEHKSGRKGCESVDENHETNNKQSTETPANTRKYRFIGSFSHGLDAKGRLVIPQPFREKLGEERDVEITGANDHILINAAAASADEWTKFMSDLPDLLEMIAGLGNPREKE